jgi:hypothetical protein
LKNCVKDINYTAISYYLALSAVLICFVMVAFPTPGSCGPFLVTAGACTPLVDADPLLDEFLAFTLTLHKLLGCTTFGKT